MRPIRETNASLKPQNLGREAVLLLAVLGLLLVVSACNRASGGQGDPMQTSAADASPTTSNYLLATDTQTVISEQPPATFTPVPTLTAPPTVISVPILPTVIVSNSQYSGQLNRLTGEAVADPALLLRRPLAVKISNAPAKWTRPQSGLSQADLVFEHLTEGSITRFTAIFYGSTPARLGPIRSARLIDLQLPLMYDAALVYSGSSIGVSRRLFDSDFRDRILRTNTPGYFRTGEDKPYEHTLYANPERLWESLEERGENGAPEFNSTMAFSQAIPQGGSQAASLTVHYYKFSAVEWRYDPVARQYFRWVDGEKHMDANNGQQVGANNVVVLLAPHRLEETICEYQSGNQCLAYSTDIQLWDEGQAQLLRDGFAYDVTWSRRQSREMLSFLDGNRRHFPLQLGNTWIQIVPTDYPDAYSITP